MPTSVRVQGPGAAITLSFEDGATLDDLRQRIASSELAIPASLQELRVGFPPQVLGAAGSGLISSELGSSARVLVKSTGGSAETSGGAGGGSSGGASSSPAKAGGGRKKAQVQRVQDGANPRDVQARADAVAAATAAQRAAAAQDAEDLENQEGRGKRARTQQRFLTPEESAAELLGEDAPAPRKRAPKPAAAPAAEPSDADSDAEPPASKASGKAAAKAPGKASGRAAKAKTAEQIAQEYFLGANSASKQPGRSGTTAYLTDLGTIEHRAEAVKQRKYELLEVGPAQLEPLPPTAGRLWPRPQPSPEAFSGGAIAAAGHLQGDAQAGVRDRAAASRGGDPRRVGGARLARQQQPRPLQQPPALAARDGDTLPRAALVPRPRLRRRRGGRRATVTRLRPREAAAAASEAVAALGLGRAEVHRPHRTERPR